MPGICPESRESDLVDFALLQLSTPLELDGATRAAFVPPPDRDFSEGRVGLYNRNLANASYGHFSVSHGSGLTPEF